jgi:Papain family cysteine protease
MYARGNDAAIAADASRYTQSYRVCKDPTTRHARIVLPSEEWLSNDYLTTSDRHVSARMPPNAGDECALIAPMNTNINFGVLSSGRGLGRLPAYRTIETYDSGAGSALKTSGADVIVPPLNTDIHFSTLLPPHAPPTTLAAAAAFDALHPHAPHVHAVNAENFSWAIITSDDSPETIAKKHLIHPIQNQQLCGSCWAVSTAAAISDCFVIGGAIDWAPSISSTYIMMCLPQRASVQQQCNGGHPAEVALALETTGVCDTTCMDYSWCTNDAELCTSHEAAQHFQSTLGDKLNANIPRPCGCYFPGERLTYTLDGGSNVWNVESANHDLDVFRKSVYAQLVDYGPTIGGFVVLRNFITGNFTDPKFNGGVFLDRADYSTPGVISFSDDTASSQNIAGLHAVAVIGWGVAKGITYDTNKVGDVPFWHCRNSWGKAWGNDNGYFRMAMYPFNKVSQFCTQVDVGGPAGSMILMRATAAPHRQQMPATSAASIAGIKRGRTDAYYSQTPDQFIAAQRNVKGGATIASILPIPIVIGIGVVALALIVVGAYLLMNRRHGSGRLR